MSNKTQEQLQRDREYQRQYRQTDQWKEWSAKRWSDPKFKESRKLYQRERKKDPFKKIKVQRSCLKSALKTRYGLTLEQWDAMLIAQLGCCACCGAQMTGKNEPAVDHSHATNAIRALLCNNCNLGIGHFQESVVRLQLAVQYLSQFI